MNKMGRYAIKFWIMGHESFLTTQSRIIFDAKFAVEFFFYNLLNYVSDFQGTQIASSSQYANLFKVIKVPSNPFYQIKQFNYIHAVLAKCSPNVKKRRFNCFSSPSRVVQIVKRDEKMHFKTVFSTHQPIDYMSKCHCDKSITPSN